jgi:hypothetical protein
MGKIDDEFAEEAKRAEAEERAKAQQKGNKGNFIDIKWTGVTKAPEMLILRFLGKHPDLHYGTTVPTISDTDARVINLARLIADNGKQMDLILPLYDRDPNHIMWRIYDKINTVNWKKTKDDKDPTKEITVKTYPNQSKYPDIFNIVNYNGLPPENLQRKFGLLGRGWKGKEVLICNVINRALLDWHKANKHSALLAKKITLKVQPDGTVMEFVEKGVPSYGLSGPLNTLRKTYGDWEKFDIGFLRTGQKESPGEVINVSRTPERVEDEALASLISTEALTAEEASWEQYNLSQIFKVTSYTKIWNRLHLTVEKIDAQLGTFYADELKKLADSETSDKKTEVDVDVEEDVPPDITEEVTEVKPVERKIVKGKLTPQDLPGYSALTDVEKNLIESVEAPKSGSAYIITYKPEASKRVGECPECSTKSPEDFKSCPGCGANFSF